MGHGNVELSANGTVDWLAQSGRQFGWNAADLSHAVLAAQQGKPAIVVWKNPTGRSGHVAILCPDATTANPFTAQAGASNWEHKQIAYGFGRLPVSIYVHE